MAARHHVEVATGVSSMPAVLHTFPLSPARLQSKIAETKEAMKKRAQEIEKTKIEAMKVMASSAVPLTPPAGARVLAGVPCLLLDL